MRLTINHQDADITSATDLSVYWDIVRNQQFSEVWLETGEDGPSLMMLVHGENAMLMYLPDQEGSLGFTSRNPAYDGSPDASIEFMLANRQSDEYPAAWAVSLTAGCAACEDFVETHGGLSSLLTWHDDNGAEAE